MAREFAAGLIEGVDRLLSRLNEADVELAESLLDATYYDPPRPPWNTGELRSSGTVYIGGQLIKKTPWTGANPVGPYANAGIAGSADPYSGGNRVQELRMRNIRQGTAGSDIVDSLRGKITVIYDSPVAALMHEWEGGFSDSESGRFYISSKLAMFSPTFYQVMKELFR